MSDIINYYQGYYKKHGEGSYTMGSAKHLSRVLQLKDWITKYVPKGGAILDVGCGDAYLAQALPEYDWSGIDVNLERACSSQSKLYEQDLMKTPYPFQARSFDAVVCSEVLEHVWDLRVVNTEIARVLKQGGYYLMSTPNFDFIDYMLMLYRPLLFNDKLPHLFEHIRQYNYDVHNQYLKEAGFTVIDYTGADAQYSGFLSEARLNLRDELNKKQLSLTEGEVDQILGRMFRKSSHTIMFASRL